jgi:putative transposase
MESLGRRYVHHVNTTYRRAGATSEGRCRAGADIDDEACFLGCCRYFEPNPVRARPVRDSTTVAGRAIARMHGTRLIRR